MSVHSGTRHRCKVPVDVEPHNTGYGFMKHTEVTLGGGVPCCAAFCRSPTGGLQVPRNSKCSKSQTQMKGSCGSFDERETDATRDNPLSATQHKTSCRTSFDANAFDSVPVGEFGADAKENEHADMDSKDERAFVGDPIEDVSENEVGDIADEPSSLPVGDCTDEVGELRA